MTRKVRMIKPCDNSSVKHANITRVSHAGAVQELDNISVEEPLQISVGWKDEGEARTKTIAITMRTPGDDEHLAAGFLFTEGIITSVAGVESIQAEGRNAVTVVLNHAARPDFSMLDRHSFISSSCGACGKRSIAAVRVARRYEIAPDRPILMPPTIHNLPETLRRAQAEFSLTGGIHASALFNAEGTLIALREDVGRHNALDKLIGAEFLAGNLPLSDRILLVSGRASFELVQKAAIAGIPFVAAVGAPSSLAVELAAECGMTLLGFVRDKRFNIYNDCSRISEHATNKIQMVDVS